MPVEKKVTVKRWRWCEIGGVLPYPCRQKVTEIQWCYFFSELTIQCHYCYTIYSGAENGASYRWREWNFPLKQGIIRKVNYEIFRQKIMTPL